MLALRQFGSTFAVLCTQLRCSRVVGQTSPDGQARYTQADRTSRTIMPYPSVGGCRFRDGRSAFASRDWFRQIGISL
jgi:hypothetical protein